MSNVLFPGEFLSNYFVPGDHISQKTVFMDESSPESVQGMHVSPLLYIYCDACCLYYLNIIVKLCLYFKRDFETLSGQAFLKRSNDRS